MSNFDENPWPTWHKMHTAIELEKSIKKQTKEMNEIKDKFYNHFPQYKEDIEVKVKEDEDKREKESHHAGFDGDDLLDCSTPSQIQPFMAGPLNSIYARNFGGNCYPPMPNMYMPPQMSMMSGPPYQQPFPPPLQMYQNPYGYGGTSYVSFVFHYYYLFLK